MTPGPGGGTPESAYEETSTHVDKQEILRFIVTADLKQQWQLLVESFIFQICKCKGKKYIWFFQKGKNLTKIVFFTLDDGTTCYFLEYLRGYFRFFVAKYHNLFGIFFSVIAELQLYLNWSTPHIFQCHLKRNLSQAPLVLYFVRKSFSQLPCVAGRLTSLFIQLNIPSIFNIHKYQTCAFIFKILPQPALLPRLVKHFSGDSSDLHNYNTRRAKWLHLQYLILLIGCGTVIFKLNFNLLLSRIISD